MLKDDDCDFLTDEIKEEDIWNAAKVMKNGKSPGNDGLSIEFYKKFWNTIKSDLLEVVRYALKHGELSPSQYQGIIKLGAKKGNLELIESWRPITLLNVDYKIISKVIANRLKYVMDKIISKEQYCGVPGRTIVHCNNTLRDLINYVNNNNLQVGLLNLDWSKAFDRVNMSFLFEIMVSMGFPEEFINWIKTLYKCSKSSLCVNGLITSSIDVKRSVR